jgi:hypothetical protein
MTNMKAAQIMVIWQQFKAEQLLDINSRAVALYPHRYWQGQTTWLHANRLWLWPDYLKAHIAQTA